MAPFYVMLQHTIFAQPGRNAKKFLSVSRKRYVYRMKESGSYHLIGIGGVGMSALAQLLVDFGNCVSGSDRFRDQGVDLPVLEVLKRAGVALYPQDGSGLASSRTVAVVSTAIEDDNADLQRAKSLGCRVAHRAELLAAMLRDKRLIAITGTSGKTTVTAMVGWILAEAGYDPTVVNGGSVIGWGTANHVGSVRWGRSDWAVIEADESDKSLLGFEPDWAVVTNISKDHFETHEALDLFREFGGRARSGVVVGADAAELALTLGPSVRVAGHEPVRHGAAWGFECEGHYVRAPGLGRHNAENAAVAVTVCRELGVSLDTAVRAVTAFPGVERRLQIVGTGKGVTVLDDYAHNPAKIRAAWTAVAERFPRVWAIWRPHGFAPLRIMMNELAESFAAVCRPEDRLFLLPVYYAGGTARQDVSSEDLALRLRARGSRVENVSSYEEIEERLRQEIRAGDAVLCMGARDPQLPRFAQRLAQVLKE